MCSAMFGSYPPLLTIARSFLSWAFILLVLFAIGPATAALSGNVADSLGTHDASLLLSASALRGLVIGVAIFAITAFVTWFGAYAFTLGIGLTCGGFVLGWASYGLGSVERIIRLNGANTNLVLLAIESLVVIMVAAFITVIACRIAEGRQPGASNESRRRTPISVFLAASALSEDRGAWLKIIAPFAASAAAAALAATLIAANGLKGQTLFAGVVAGIAAGFAGAYVASAMKSMVWPLVPMLAMALTAAVGMIVTKFTHGSGLVEAVYADKLLALGRILPLDWAAGGLIGVPMGMSWRGVLLDARALEAHSTPTDEASPNIATARDV